MGSHIQGQHMAAACVEGEQNRLSAHGSIIVSDFQDQIFLQQLQDNGGDRGLGKP